MKPRAFHPFLAVTLFFLVLFQSAAPASLMADTFDHDHELEIFVLPEKSIEEQEAGHGHSEFESGEEQAATSIDELMQDGGLAAARPESPEEARPDTGGGSTTLKLSKIKSSETTPYTTLITWTTNVASNSLVQYGTTPSLGTSVTDNSMVKNHSVSLTGLNSGTLYYYRVLSTDAGGVEKVSANFTFTTLVLDVTAPLITNVNPSNTSQTQTTINWTTNEPADTQIEYGTTTAYGQFSPLNSNLVTSHSQTLSNLSADTLYHYRVISRDASGNTTVSGDFTFQTLAVNTGGSLATVFLNFMGAYIPQWGGYSNVVMNAFTGAGSVIADTLAAMIEKYSIFNLNVTTTDPYASDGNYVNDTAEEANARYNYYAQNRILEVAIGTSSSQSQICPGGCGGVAYVNSFTSSYVNSVLVFSNSLANTARYIWEASAHEAGHGFGLSHQSTWNGTQLVSAYSQGNGIVSPIMGNSYYSSRGGQWWYGATNASPTSFQDDIAVIARQTNGFGLRPDEAGDAPNAAAAFSDVFGTSFSTDGVITSLQDKDYYEFTTTAAGNVSFAGSIAPYGGMLDMVLEIRDAADNLITSASTSSLGESLNYFLPAGKYYLVVRSQAVYYGDLGQYWINATVPFGTTTTAGPNAPAGSAAFGGSSGEGGLSAGESITGSFGIYIPAHAAAFEYTDAFFIRTLSKSSAQSSRISRPMKKAAAVQIKKPVLEAKDFLNSTADFSSPLQIISEPSPVREESEIFVSEKQDMLTALFETQAPQISEPREESQVRQESRAVVLDEKSLWLWLLKKEKFAPSLGLLGNIAQWISSFLHG